MGNGAPAADLRREDEACAQERHRNVRKIEIELNPRTYEESARKKFAELSSSNRKIERGQTEDDERYQQNWKHVLLLVKHSIFGISTPAWQIWVFSRPAPIYQTTV